MHIINYPSNIQINPLFLIEEKNIPAGADTSLRNLKPSKAMIPYQQPKRGIFRDFILYVFTQLGLEDPDISDLRAYVKKSNSAKDPSAPGIILCHAAESENSAFIIKNMELMLQHVAKTHFIALQIVTYGDYLPYHITIAKNEMQGRRIDSLIISTHGLADGIWFNRDIPYTSQDVKPEHFPLPLECSILLQGCYNGYGIGPEVARAVAPRPVYAFLDSADSASTSIAPCCPQHGIGMASREETHSSHDDVILPKEQQTVRIFQKKGPLVEVLIPCRASK